MYERDGVFAAYIKYVMLQAVCVKITSNKILFVPLTCLHLCILFGSNNLKLCYIFMQCQHFCYQLSLHLIILSLEDNLAYR